MQSLIHAMLVKKANVILLKYACHGVQANMNWMNFNTTVRKTILQSYFYGTPGLP